MTQYQPHTPNRTRSRGFTLVELMVTVAIMGIIAAFAIPSFSHQLASRRIDSTSKTLNQSLKAAISESVIRRKRILYVVDAENHQVVLHEYDPTKPGDDTKGSVIQTFPFSKDSKIKYSGYKLISGNGAAVTIGPGKSVKSRQSSTPGSLTLTICDEVISDAIPRTIKIDAIANIQQTSGGNCS